jgi:hypothetical protein
MDENRCRWALGISKMITWPDISKMYPHLTDAIVAAYVMPAAMDTIGWDVHLPSYAAGYFKAQQFYQELELRKNNES